MTNGDRTPLRAIEIRVSQRGISYASGTSRASVGPVTAAFLQRPGAPPTGRARRPSRTGPPW